TLQTDNGAVDLAVGMFGGRERPELALLRGDGTTEMFAPDAQGNLASEYTGLLSSSNVTRMAVLDVNGDSPSRHAVGDPKLGQGSVVPVSVLTIPPYSRTHSDGKPTVSMGRESSKTEGKANGTQFTVIAGLSYGQEFNAFGKILEAEVEGHFEKVEWRM